MHFVMASLNAFVTWSVSCAMAAIENAATATASRIDRGNLRELNDADSLKFVGV
jgi:predicted MarR family transcription regulator